jgi:TATA-binding protein-associated factor
LDCGIGRTPGDPLDDFGDSGATADHRVLIFAQTKDMLDIIQAELFTKLMPSVSYMRLDGSTDALHRHDIVQTFNNDPSIDVLLLTTSIGGLGLTLTGADTVIFMDHDWNPMKDAQAMDRAHRIGQKKVVNVYRLITRGTLEEKIMRYVFALTIVCTALTVFPTPQSLQKFKLNIANTVVNEQNSGLDSMNTDQVLDLFNVDNGEVERSSGTSKEGGALTRNQLLDVSVSFGVVI